MTADEVKTAFKYAVWFANSIGYEDFAKLFKKMLDDDRLTDGYVQENWERLQKDFARWVVNLSDGAQLVFFEAVLAKYQK